MKELLKKYGLKVTNGRLLVLDVIKQLDDEANIRNIINMCSDKIDKSTIYRILELFEDKKLVSKKVTYDNEICYHINNEHGHYFTCIKCHKKIKLDTCPLEQIDHELEEKKGFKVLNHVVEIDGVCDNCGNL